MGYIGLMVSEEYGGIGAGLLTAMLFGEEVARKNVGIATAFTNPQIILPPIEQFRTEQQKQKFLIPSAKGEMIQAIALTEPAHAYPL